MSGRSSLRAGAEQEAALRELAKSPVRGEAGEIATRFARDRARAVLLTLAGWTAPQIAEAFGVGEDAARRWRALFTRSGIDALRLPLAAGPSPERGARGGTGGPAAATAPRAGRGGRRGAALRRRKRGADPRRFRGAKRRPCLAHAWAERGADLRVQAPRRNAQRLRPGQARKVAMSGEPLGSTLGVLDAITRMALVHTSPTKRSSDFIALLEQLGRAHGPVPGQTRKPVVLVPDNGPIHTSRASLAALAARRPWLAVEWLPRHAPELSAIEGAWRHLKRHHLAHRIFRNADELNQAIHQAVILMNTERTIMHPCRNLPKAA